MRFTCDHCNYKSDVKSNLLEHIRAKHSPRDPNLNKCSKCEKSFLWQSSLWKHLILFLIFVYRQKILNLCKKIS